MSNGDQNERSSRFPNPDDMVRRRQMEDEYAKREFEKAKQGGKNDEGDIMADERTRIERQVDDLHRKVDELSGKIDHVIEELKKK